MLAYLRGPIVVSGWIAEVAGNDPYKIMFALVALFTIVGDFIEPIPCVVILMPIVAALTEIGGIHPVHMGVVLIVTLAFGLITPLRVGAADGGHDLAGPNVAYCGARHALPSAGAGRLVSRRHAPGIRSELG